MTFVFCREFWHENPYEKLGENGFHSFLTLRVRLKVFLFKIFLVEVYLRKSSIKHFFSKNNTYDFKKNLKVFPQFYQTPYIFWKTLFKLKTFLKITFKRNPNIMFRISISCCFWTWVPLQGTFSIIEIPISLWVLS